MLVQYTILSILYAFEIFHNRKFLLEGLGVIPKIWRVITKEVRVSCGMGLASAK